MKKNLLHADAVELLINRVEQLQPDRSPLWGSMTPVEMLVHCNAIHSHLLTPSGEKLKKRTTVIQFLARWLVLYVIPRYPRHAKAPQQVRTAGKVPSADFNEEKEVYKQLLRRFSSLQAPIRKSHPYFGNLSTKQWGLAMWKHADHHLRQFGV